MKKSKNHKVYNAQVFVLPFPFSLLTGSWLCFVIAAAASHFILLRITAFS